MGKKFCLILTLVAVICACGCVTPERSDYCVRILCSADGKEFSGVGTAIEGGYILTVAHIFPNSYEERNICVYDICHDNKYETEILFIDRTNDLALLRNDDTAGVSLSEKMPRQEEKLFLCRPGERFEVTYTRMRSCDAEGKPAQLMELNSYVAKGISGAPLINKSGTLTGIICARDTTYAVSYAIGEETISSFLERALEEERCVSPLP